MLCTLVALPTAAADTIENGALRDPGDDDADTAGALGLTQHADDAARAPAVPAAALPWARLADHGNRRGLVATHGGFDASRGRATWSSEIEINLHDRVVVRGAADSLAGAGTSVGDGATLLRPSLGVAVDILRARDGRAIDLAVGTDYETTGFNLVPSVVGHVAVGARTGAVRWLASAALGVGLEESELYGDVRVGALRSLGAGFTGGLDARARIDLERDLDEPPGEPDWEPHAGPTLTYLTGRFALTAATGLAASRLRLMPDTRIGALAMVGASTAF